MRRDGHRWGLHNLRHSLSNWLVNKAKENLKTAPGRAALEVIGSTGEQSSDVPDCGPRSIVLTASGSVTDRDDRDETRGQRFSADQYWPAFRRVQNLRSRSPA